VVLGVLWNCLFKATLDCITALLASFCNVFDVFEVICCVFYGLVYIPSKISTRPNKIRSIFLSARPPS